MPDEVTFMDLATLSRITPETTLEKLGSAINASIYDASNIAGSLKQKGLIDFSAYYPGPTTVTITDSGKALLAEAQAKATEPFDNLDSEILMQLSGGKRIPIDLQNSLNLRPRDLALRLSKLSKQGFLSYNLKSGGADISLTEAGFLKAKTSGIPIPQPPTATQPNTTSFKPQQPALQQPAPVATPQQQLQSPAQPQQPQAQPQTNLKTHPGLGMPAKILIIMLLAAAVLLLGYGLGVLPRGI
jgi:DNA-binding MarR family transcriptional regulator